MPASIQNAVNVSFVSDLSQVFELALMQGTEHIEERKDDVLVYPAQTVPGIICRD